MSNLAEITRQIQKLPVEQAEATTSLIDVQVEAQMEKVMARFDSLEAKMEARFQVIDHCFQAIEHKITTLYWVTGGVVALVAAIIRFLPSH